MKSIFLIILFSFFYGNKLVAQLRSIEVDYTFKTTSQQGETVTFYKTLLDNGEKSIFIDKDTITPKNLNKMIVLGKDGKKSNGLFYDKKLNKAQYYSPIFSRDFWVQEDSLTNLLSWNFENSKSKSILDFACKSATTTFRGRNYTAYYTEEIPFYSGPWKFFGLPGLILEISTDDDLFRYEAFRYTGRNDKIEINNPYEGKSIDFISFIDYKTKYLQKLMDAQNSARSREKDEDVEYTFKDGSMELLK